MFAQNRSASRIVSRLFQSEINWNYGAEVARCLVTESPLPEIGQVDPIVASAIRSWIVTGLAGERRLAQLA